MWEATTGWAMARISRRRLLLGGGAAATALGSGAGVVGLALSSPADGFRVLCAGEVAIVRAAAIAMFPGAPFPVDGLQARVAEEVDAILADTLDTLRASGFRAVLEALEWGTVAGRGARFSRLDVATRRAVLDTWAEPELFTRRIAGDSVRAVLGMAYFAHPEVLAHMEWDGACTGGGAT